MNARSSFTPLLGVVLLLGCLILGCEKSPKPGTPSTNTTAEASGTPEAPAASPVPVKVAPDEPPLTKDGRWVFSLSDAGFLIKGSPVQIGRTSKSEFEKILGPSDRAIDLGHLELAFWDKKGISIHFSKQSGKAEYFNFMFLTDKNQPLFPTTAFGDVFKVDGVEVFKTVTKNVLQRKISKNLRDHPGKLTGFSTEFQNHRVAFEQGRDRKNLESIVVSAPIGFRP